MIFIFLDKVQELYHLSIIYNSQSGSLANGLMHLPEGITDAAVPWLHSGDVVVCVLVLLLLVGPPVVQSCIGVVQVVDVW